MDAIEYEIAEASRARKADRYSFVESSVPGTFLLALDGEILPGICSIRVEYNGRGVERNIYQVFIETFAEIGAARKEKCS